MQHKIVGCLLVCVGLLLILFAAVGMYKVFVGHQPVVAVVQLADMNMQSQLGTMVIPMSNLNTLANLGLFALFMTMLVIIGEKLASIGCNFLKIERIYEALAQQQEPPTKEQIKQL